MENSLGLHESQPVTALFAAVSKISVVVFLLASMSEIGLGLTLQQIVLPLRNIRLIPFSLLANFIIAPALALGIARLLRLEEPFAMGLLLLGLSAGAPFMPGPAEYMNPGMHSVTSQSEMSSGEGRKVSIHRRPSASAGSSNSCGSHQEFRIR